MVHDGNVVGEVFIRRCERKGGHLVNTLIKRYPDVSQFWTYDEKAFLANPALQKDMETAEAELTAAGLTAPMGEAKAAMVQ